MTFASPGDKLTVVAIVYSDDGGPCIDKCYTWESGQNYALSMGYKVIAVADDGFMTMEMAQELYDAERARYRDCFGI